MHLTGEASVRPIVRNFSSLARLARFELDWRVTELTDVPKLTEALRGCDVLLHSIVGDESVILGSVAPVYKAAQLAGIRRIVYLSSSAVHGLAPDPSTSEETPLSTRQPFTYNNAKVRAEKLWAQLRSTGNVEIVGLRPSIVFGPRSRWCSDLASEALNGEAYFLREGTGICNTIYVDNLLHAIELAARTANVDGHYFLVRDRESVTWKDFYEPILQACGAQLRDVHRVEAPVFRRSWRDFLADLRGSSFLRTIKPLSPRVAIRLGKATLNALPAPAPSSPWPGAGKPQPQVTAEMAALQQCEWRMPCAKSEKLLDYQPQISFAEGMKRSIGWLQFAGYPVTTTG
ncbi:MAG: NAD(P)-dependent oxidoreductase [Methylacidiphilales bacterium]|nr:NAD(P)-dependent oxidoreductase [Candidatus Methylacidiphilales bacterium]